MSAEFDTQQSHGGSVRTVADLGGLTHPLSELSFGLIGDPFPPPRGCFFCSSV